MGEESGSDSGDANSELFGDKLCRVIENGKLVRYFVRDGSLVKEVYINRKPKEVSI